MDNLSIYVLQAQPDIYFSFETFIFFMVYVSQQSCLCLKLKLLKRTLIYTLPWAPFCLD